MGNTLKEASVKKDGILNELHEALEYGEQLILAENNEMDEMADVRGGRQKSVLLEKASSYAASDCVEVPFQNNVVV